MWIQLPYDHDHEGHLNSLLISFIMSRVESQDVKTCFIMSAYRLFREEFGFGVSTVSTQRSITYRFSLLGWPNTDFYYTIPEKFGWKSLIVHKLQHVLHQVIFPQNSSYIRYQVWTCTHLYLNSDHLLSNNFLVI